MKIFALILFAVIVPLTVCAENQIQRFEAGVDADGIQRITMKGGDFFFAPNHIVVKKDIPVELSITKEGGIVPHNIVMDSADAGIQFDVALGKEPAVIRFTPVRAGTYPFYCTKKFLFFKSHRERGMEGVIEVIE